jgi:hypothetical protein
MLSNLGYSDTGDVLDCRSVTLGKKVENDFDQIIHDEIGCNEMRVKKSMSPLDSNTLS